MKDKKMFAGIIVFVTLIIALIIIVVLTNGKTDTKENKKGIYRTGVYFGSNDVVGYDGSKFVTTAVITVDENNKISNVFIDETYVANDVKTTKKTLGDSYGMKATSKKIGVIEGGSEWYEQVKVIEDKVVAEQSTSWAKFDNAKKLDGVSGCTITANNYIKAIENAIAKAK